MSIDKNGTACNVIEVRTIMSVLLIIYTTRRGPVTPVRGGQALLTEPSEAAVGGGQQRRGGQQAARRNRPEEGASHGEGP